MKLNRKTLEAVVYAVESLSIFDLIDSGGAIKKLVALDDRIPGMIKTEEGQRALEFLGFKPIIEQPQRKP